MRAEAKYYLVAKGLAIPKPLLWGKDNDPTEWWNINDFKILSACYGHEVEMVLKIVAPHFPRVQELDDYSFPELCTPTGKSALPSSVTELPPPWKFRSAQGEPHNRFHLPPLSTITSRRNLTRLISDKPVTPSEKEVNSDYPPRAPWNNRNDSENPFSKEDDPKEVNDKQDKIPRRMERLIPPGGPPSDGSSSDSESEPNRPPKIPPRSDKRPLTKSNSAEPAVKSYHFNLKLKPETVPQWDGNADTLARWLNKINHLADGSTHVHRELGKIVPQRFTSSAETWYYSIPDYECVKAKVNWSCLRNIISGYWMNHHWLEKQKIQANKARFRETSHQRESPSEYVIRKLELIGLVYNYTNSETIQAIMEEVPDSWASILNPQYLKSITEFQNAVKYHEETLVKLESPTPQQPQRLPNQEFSNN